MYVTDRAQAAGGHPGPEAGGAEGDQSGWRAWTTRVFCCVSGSACPPAGVCHVGITERHESRIFKAAPRAWPASEDLFRAPGIEFLKGTSHARCRADAVSLEGLPPVLTAALSSAPPA